MRVYRGMPAVLFGAPLFWACACFIFQPAAARQQSESQTEWPSYGGGPDGIRYSSLTQINRANVSQLQVAWTYDCGEGPGGTQTQPLVAGGVLYAVTPQHKIVALDAATGKQSCDRRDVGSMAVSEKIRFQVSGFLVSGFTTRLCWSACRGLELRVRRGRLCSAGAGV